MNRCARCGAPVPEGIYTCLPNRSLTGWEFYGCHVAPRSRGVSVPSKNHRPTDGTPLRACSLFIAYEGQSPRWVFDADFRPHRWVKEKRRDKYAPGSMWTNQRYGFNWSQFTRILRSIARKKHLPLIGFHTSTLAAADLIDDLLFARVA